jgi:hypothetical protein
VTIAQSAALADEVTAVNILGRRMAKYGVADSSPRRRMGSIKFAGRDQSAAANSPAN